MRATVVFLFSAALLTTSASAQTQDCSGKSAIPYCYCVYENALQEIKDNQGSDSATMSQRVEAAKKALKSCLNRGTEEVEDGIQKVSVNGPVTSAKCGVANSRIQDS